METLLYLAKSTAILGIFYINYLVVLRKDTFFNANRHYLLGGIIAALLLPFLEFTQTTIIDMPALTTSFAMDDFSPVSWQTVAPVEETFEINWWQVALVSYLIGIAIMGIRFGVQLFSLLRLIKSGRHEQHSYYTFVKVAQDITPFSFFKYIVYNPDMHAEADLKMILAHEQVHASQWHSIDVLLTQLALGLQWANPLAWFYKRSLEQNLEFIADSEAAQRVSSPKAYQLTLVKVSSTPTRPALTNNFYHSLIKKRIVMLNKEASNRRNLWKLGIVLPMLALFMYSFNVKEVVEYRELPPENITLANSEIKNKVHQIVIEPGVTDNELAIWEDALQQEGIDMAFSEVERTSHGNIAKITLDTKVIGATNISNWTFTEKTKDQGIANVMLTYNFDAKTTEMTYGSLSADQEKNSFEKVRSILANSKWEQQFIISAKVTDEYLKKIERYFKDNFESTEIRFTKVNHINGKLHSFDFQTKMADDKRFINRYSINPQNSLPINPINIVPLKEHEILQIDSKGHQMRFTAEDATTTFKLRQGEESMGQNPVYIVNGKVMEIPIGSKTTYTTPDAVQYVLPQQAMAKYGAVARDGAIVINDPTNSTKINGKYIATPKAFRVNNTTTEAEINFYEDTFKKAHPEAYFDIHKTKRSADGQLIAYSVRTKFINQDSWNDILGMQNAETVSKGMEISFDATADVPAILFQELGPKGILMRSTPKGLEVESEEIGNGLTAYSEGMKALNEQWDTLTDADNAPYEVKQDGSFRVKITKNTSIEELKAMKVGLKEKHNVDFKYSNVDFNEAGEITGIKIKYKAPNGNSSNYSVSSDHPIADFYIYMEANGAMGIGNAKSSKEAREMMEQRMEEREEKREYRRRELEEKREIRREMLEEKRKEMREEMREKRKEMRTEVRELSEKREKRGKREKEVEEVRSEVRKKMEEDIEKMKEGVRSAHESGTVKINGEDHYFTNNNGGKKRYFTKFGVEVDEKGKEVELEEGDAGYERINGNTVYFVIKNGKKSYYTRFGEAMNDQGTEVDSNKSPFFQNSNVDVSGSSIFIVGNGKGYTANANLGGGVRSYNINGDTSDQALTLLKQTFLKDNIYFDYTMLKRNSEGKITAITIHLRDDYHSNSANFGSETDTPIKSITVGHILKK